MNFYIEFEFRAIVRMLIMMQRNSLIERIKNQQVFLMWYQYISSADKEKRTIKYHFDYICFEKSIFLVCSYSIPSRCR